jgi:asparagine N-glycosylation enzyme membrane subunit Stt3
MTKTREYLYLGLLLILTFLTNCLHLLTHHTPVVNPDSFFFAWESQLPTQFIPILHSGLAWPLHYLGTFGIIVLPPLCGILTALVIYFSVKRIFSFSVNPALFSVLAFAVARPVILLTCAGNVDRDCLTLLLITCGMMTYYFFSSWKGSLLLLLISALLYVESTWLSVAILLFSIISCHIVLEIFLKRHEERSMLLWFLIPLALACIPFIPSIYSGISTILSPSYRHISELDPITIIDLSLWVFLTIPIYFGITSLLHAPNRRYSFLFFITWILSSILIGLFAKRLALYMIPAIVIIAGCGLSSIFSFQQVKNHTTEGFRIIAILLIIISFFAAAKLPAAYIASPDLESACSWLKSNTPQSAWVTSWWDSGHMIRYLSNRNVVVDNGNHSTALDQSVADIYVTDNTALAVSIMVSFNSDYLLFDRSSKDIYPVIKQDASISASDNSLYSQFLSGEVPTGLIPVYSNDSISIYSFK